LLTHPTCIIFGGIPRVATRGMSPGTAALLMTRREVKMCPRFLALTLVLGTAGCAPGPVPVSSPDVFGGITSRKELVAKRAPATLVARDGSVCGVAPDWFRNVNVGETIPCRWRRG
jgi:hypothetical protein